MEGYRMDPKLKSTLIWVAIAALLMLLGIILKRSHKKDIESMNNILSNLDNFNTTEYVVDFTNTRALALDKNSNSICLIDTKCLLQKTVTRYFNYKDLISSEIIKHGETVSKTSRSSQIAGAIAGGLVFGGVGAVIGGLSGKRKTSTKMYAVSLRIIVNDKENPLFALLLNKNYPEAVKWHKILTKLIKKADREEVPGGNVATANNEQLSVADELLKLADLKDKGVISEEEFTIQKKRILN
jgi:hypothetical protein